MKSLRAVPPVCTTGRLCTPADEMDMLLAEHYGQRAERYRAEAQGFVDDKLREVFPPVDGRPLLSAADMIRKHRLRLTSRVARWSGLDEKEIDSILSKLEDRAEALALSLRANQLATKLLDVTAMVTALAMDFVYTGRLTE